MQQPLSCVADLPLLLDNARGLEDGEWDAESTASLPQDVWNSLAFLNLALKRWLHSLEVEFDGTLYCSRNGACSGSVHECLESR
jgi:hypothetical protein